MTAECELAQDGTAVSTSYAMIEDLRLEIAKLRRKQYGPRSGAPYAPALSDGAPTRETEAAVTRGFDRRRETDEDTSAASFERQA